MRVPLPEVFLQAPIAHRALHDVKDGRPENSLAAIRAAITAGYGIEIDIQMSRDREAFVFHDYTLARLTDQQGTFKDLDTAALSQVHLTGNGEQVPTLRAALDLIGGRVAVLIEIKDQDGQMGPGIGALEDAVADALAGYEGPAAVMSFNPHTVRRMADLLPGLPRGLVTCAYRTENTGLPDQVCSHLREIPDFDRAECSFISHDVRDLQRPRVSDLKSQGHSILCWTVRSPDQEAEARRIADNITFETYLAAHPS
ncbi:MAG: glycerophosphodiester phosphodiesterase family protein [Roseobacter sp.]